MKRLPQHHRVIFFAHNGPGPYSCFFCEDEVTIDKVLIHHKDHNHDNDEAANLKAAHRACHTRYHALLDWAALSPEDRQRKSGPWIESRLRAARRPKADDHKEKTRVLQFAHWQGLTPEQRKARGVQSQIGKVFAATRRQLAVGDSVFVRDFCFSCQRWVEHRPGSCPRLQLVKRPPTDCVCGIHTCFYAEELVGPDGDQVYRDFP